MHVYSCWIPCYDPSADNLFCLYSVLALMSWKVYIDRERESEELVSIPVNPGLLCAGLFVQRRNITMLSMNVYCAILPRILSIGLPSCIVSCTVCNCCNYHATSAFCNYCRLCCNGHPSLLRDACCNFSDSAACETFHATEHELQYVRFTSYRTLRHKRSSANSTRTVNNLNAAHCCKPNLSCETNHTLIFTDPNTRDTNRTTALLCYNTTTLQSYGFSPSLCACQCTTAKHHILLQFPFHTDGVIYLHDDSQLIHDRKTGKLYIPSVYRVL
jgi:hypothetical protein